MQVTMEEDNKPALVGGANMFAQAVAQASSNSGNSGRSRRASASADADPLADILSKLGLGDEGSGSTVVAKQDTDQAAHVLMEVLQVDWEQAKFFLESSQNDVAKAVNLHFELADSNKNQQPSKRSRPIHNTHGRRHRWVERPVEIAGLPPGWRAFVSRTQGNIVFEHLESKYQQNHVPEGFADDLRVNAEDDEMATSGNGLFGSGSSSSDSGADSSGGSGGFHPLSAGGNNGFGAASFSFGHGGYGGPQEASAGTNSSTVLSSNPFVFGGTGIGNSSGIGPAPVSQLPSSPPSSPMLGSSGASSHGLGASIDVQQPPLPLAPAVPFNSEHSTIGTTFMSQSTDSGNRPFGLPPAGPSSSTSTNATIDADEEL